MLPQLTPATELGAVFAAAYAAREGTGAAARGGPGGTLTPEQVGEAVIGLASGPVPEENAYLITAAGLRPLP
jgi:hypothetical protein